MRKHPLGMKPVQGPLAQILQFPNDTKEIQSLMSQEKILQDDLRKHETYDERVETRKLLKENREKLYGLIKQPNKNKTL